VLTPKLILTFLLSTILILFSLLSFSQVDITYQSDSVYKVNKVKYRVVTFKGSHSKNYQDNFDKAGRCTEKITFDTLGKMLFQSLFEYDNNGRLLKQSSYTYLYTDTVTKKRHVVSVRDSAKYSSTSFQYDSLNRLIKKVSKKQDGTIFSEVIIMYNPKILTEKYWSGDSIYRESVYYYGKDNLPVKELYDYVLRGQKRTSEYKYKYSFDKSGNLKTRTTKIVGSEYEFTNPNLDKTIFFEQESLLYNSNGLLVEVVYSNPSDNSRGYVQLLMEYYGW
jgi:hypothetical protein